MMDSEYAHDPYSWLEDGISSSTRAWIEMERLRLAEALGSHELRGPLRLMLAKLLETGATESPYISGGRLFYIKRAPGHSQGALMVRDGIFGDERTVFDPLEHEFDHFSSLSILGVSRNGERVGLAIRKDGHDEPNRNIVLSVNTGEITGLPPLGPQSCLMPDLETMIIVLQRDSKPTLWLRSIGSSREEYICAMPTNVPEAYLHSLATGRFVIVEPIRGGATKAAWLGDCESKKLTSLVRDFGWSTVFRTQDESVFMLTDWEAPRQRVLSARLLGSDVEATWHQIIPESNDYIHNILVAADALLAIVFGGAEMAIKVYDLAGRSIDGPTVPRGGTTSDFKCDGTSGYAAFEYSSPSCAPTILIYKVRGETILWNHQPALLDLSTVVTSVNEFSSKDGTRVPISLSYRQDLCPDGKGPILLTGYGGYGVSFTPKYSTRSVAWIALGGVYATANIRGGGEFGKEWHKGGRRGQKQNCFDDFIAAAEWLIETRCISHDRLAVVGGSNGGLTVAAAITQRPELFAAAVIFGPLCDMLRFHLFPGGRRVGADEYGLPDIPEECEWLRQYSPYHHICLGTKYPAVLVISGDADTRCDPMHARKMVGKLRDATTAGKPVLLDYHPKRGHAALLPLPERIETLTNQFCFLLDQLGLTLSVDGLIKERGAAPITV